SFGLIILIDRTSDQVRASVNLSGNRVGVSARTIGRGEIMEGENEPKAAAPDWKAEEAYWRKQHSSQPYADKNRSYDHYAAADLTGFEGAGKYRGKRFDEVEESLAADYEQSEPGSAIPWDTVRPAVKAAWDRLGGVIAPRDPDRGMRDSI